MTYLEHLCVLAAQLCYPPCLSMRNNAPVEHCEAEAFILHREIALTMKANVTLRAYPDLRHEYPALKNEDIKRLPHQAMSPQFKREAYPPALKIGAVLM